jgi:hypothetical protein
MNNLRSYRVAGIAMFDVTLSIVGLALVFAVARRVWWPTRPLMPYMVTAAVLAIPIGIAFHIIFGTDSTLNARIGVSNYPSHVNVEVA